MIKSNFLAEMGRVFNVFNKSNYPDERLDLIFEEVKYLSESHFTSLVDFFIKGKKGAPLPNDFRKEAARFAPVRKNLDSAQTSSNAFCEHCQDSGAVLKTDERHYVFAYRCKCSNGSKKPNLTRWA